MASKDDHAKGDKPSSSHRILWISISVFIVLAIAGMWAIDFYFSPEMIRSSSLPDAVGK